MQCFWGVPPNMYVFMMSTVHKLTVANCRRFVIFNFVFSFLLNTILKMKILTKYGFSLVGLIEFYYL